MLSILRKLHFLFLVGVVVTMPFSFDHLKFNSYFIVLLAVNSILLYFFSKDKPKPVFAGLFLLFILFYLIHILGLFQTDNFHEAVFELQKKVSLLIFPLILFFSPKLDEKEIKTILLSFVGSCLLAGLFCLVVASYHFIVKDDSSFFFYHAFSEIVGMHASYLSMYFSFSIAILLCIYFKDSDFFSIKDRIIYYSTLLIFILTIVLLGARMQMLLLILGTIMYFILWFNKRHSMFKSISAAFVIGFFVMVLVLIFPSNRERFKQAINYKGEYSINTKWGEQQFRPLMWSCALDLIKSKPLTGVGTGDVQDELQKCYLDHEYGSLTYWDNIRLNAHNQFLETAIGIGVPGFLLLVFGFIGAMAYAYKQRQIIYFVFIILFITSCLTESMLERQNGIVFFALFNSLFGFGAFSPKTD